MFTPSLFFAILAVSALWMVAAPPDTAQYAVAYANVELVPAWSSGVTGDLMLMTTRENIFIIGRVHGLDEGLPGIHVKVHARGDIDNNCENVGDLFNPGHLGTIVAEDDPFGVGTHVYIVNEVLRLREVGNKNDVAGRSIVLYALENNLDEDANSIGNTRVPLACGHIAVVSKTDFNH